MTECFACFSDDCDSCEGCDCSHSSAFSDPRPKGCTTCSYTRARYANAYTLRVDHATDCPHRAKPTLGLAKAQRTLFGTEEERARQ